VVSLHLARHAASTAVTVEGVLCASNPADAALVAVIDLLLFEIIIPEFADFAVVARKVNLALFASLRWALNMIAPYTLDLLCSKAVELMRLLDIVLILVLDLVMAESAWKELLAVLALLEACPSVVRASLFHWAPISPGPSILALLACLM